jgi:hypothetical protein
MPLTGKAAISDAAAHLNQHLHWVQRQQAHWWDAAAHFNRNLHSHQGRQQAHWWDAAPHYHQLPTIQELRIIYTRQRLLQ